MYETEKKSEINRRECYFFLIVSCVLILPAFSCVIYSQNTIVLYRLLFVVKIYTKYNQNKDSQTIYLPVHRMDKKTSSLIKGT